MCYDDNTGYSIAWNIVFKFLARGVIIIYKLNTSWHYLLCNNNDNMHYIDLFMNDEMTASTLLLIDNSMVIKT